jgi:hypothetical protein
VRVTRRSGRLRRLGSRFRWLAFGSALAVLGLGAGAASTEASADLTHTDAGMGAGDAEAGVGPRPKVTIPPDPPPLRERMQWVFDLRWDRDEVYLLQVHKLDMGEPHVTPRMMGRFALELYEGPTLIERVRFDFPLLGEPEQDDAGPRWKAPVKITQKLKTRIGVLFPATSRGTRLELWDRASDRRWPLPWPPQETVYGALPDAGPR